MVKSIKDEAIIVKEYWDEMKKCFELAICVICYS